MKIEKAGDLIFWTYHMMRWEEVSQSPSSQRCVECGRMMLRVEPMEDSKGARYDGLVCHNCKRLIWIKSA